MHAAPPGEGHSNCLLVSSRQVWTQELWISSKTSTQQIPFPQIRDVTSEPIKGHEDYHIVVRPLPLLELLSWTSHALPSASFH
jgi:hypothetical protein